MSDSFNKLFSTVEPFDSKEYFSGLCLDTKILLPASTSVKFERGWVSIVNDCIEEIKTYSIVICSVADDYAMLDIQFDPVKTNREVKVWRSINNARLYSKEICANCGDPKGYRSRIYINKYCEKCAKNSHKTSSTGTWLDKY